MRKIFPIHLIIPFVWILTIASNIEPIFSQTKKIDSLKLAIVRAKEDSVKVNIFVQPGEGVLETARFR